MTNASTSAMDENTRRYYLDVMGVQCWQQIGSQPADSQSVDPQHLDEIQNGVSASLELDNAIQQCTDCTLHKTRKQALVGRGNPSAKLMFVVLSPNASDDENATLCSGAENELFSKMLAAIDINSDDVYITSLLKCRVPKTHTVTPKEIQSCNHFLSQQIQSVKPALIIVLGETAIRCMLQKDVAIDDCRQKNDALSEEGGLQVEGVPLFVSYSPNELLQKPDNKRKAWSDLQQLQKMNNIK